MNGTDATGTGPADYHAGTSDPTRPTMELAQLIYSRMGPEERAEFETLTKAQILDLYVWEFQGVQRFVGFYGMDIAWTSVMSAAAYQRKPKFGVVFLPYRIARLFHEEAWPNSLYLHNAGGWESFNGFYPIDARISRATMCPLAPFDIKAETGKLPKTDLAKIQNGWIEATLSMMSIVAFAKKAWDWGQMIMAMGNADESTKLKIMLNRIMSTDLPPRTKADNLYPSARREEAAIAALNTLREMGVVTL